MPRETKEEIAARRAEEERQREVERKEFLVTLPKRMFEAQALAQSLSISTVLSLTDKGPSLHFYNDDNPYIDTTINYDSNFWEMDSIEDTLKTLKVAADARAARRKRAQEVFSGLSVEDREAIKENIYSLKYS